MEGGKQSRGGRRWERRGGGRLGERMKEEVEWGVEVKVEDLQVGLRK